ncbi:MAG: hypothetical protein JWQ49_5014 [Edaphobacter sp.]|nr:hypothetical protein [Edaphobacter sp.]
MRRRSPMRPWIRFGRFGCDDVMRNRGFRWVSESGRASHDAHISKSRYGAPGSVAGLEKAVVLLHAGSHDAPISKSRYGDLVLWLGGGGLRPTLSTPPAKLEGTPVCNETA